jgi:uncharacterized protein YggE
MKRLILVPIFASLLASAACSGTPQVIQLPAAAAPIIPDRPLPQFSVTGQAKLEVTPNCADLMLTVSSEAPKSAAATTSTLAKQADLITRLEAAGVARSDIKLSAVQISPTFTYSSSGTITSRTFRGEVRVTVTTKDFGKISDLMDASAAAGVSAMTSSFRHDGIEQLKKQVRDLALAAAREKASQMAAGLAFELGPVVGLTENPTGYMWQNGYFPNVRAAAETSLDAVDGMVGIGVEAQEISVDVSVSYEIKRT